MDIICDSGQTDCLSHDAVGAEQFTEAPAGKEDYKLVAFTASHVNGDRGKKQRAVLGDARDIGVFHFQVPQAGRNRQFAGFVGNGIVIRNDVAAQKTVVTEAYNKQVLFHGIYLRQRHRPLIY